VNIMKAVFLTAAVLLVAMPAPRAEAQTAADSTAIIATALDYIEGWYEGNAERMTRALHPDLAKRIVRETESGSSLSNMTAAMLVEAVERGGGKGTPAERQQKDVTILDIYQGTASVKIVAGDWVDQLQVARLDGEWKIVNVLWALKPR
jgi:hypothetical protein